MRAFSGRGTTTHFKFCAQHFRRISGYSGTTGTSSNGPASLRNPFPYPSQRHPSPHQIFHLPQKATADDVKSRYYELVRIYHPDSPVTRATNISPEVARFRFHSITTAYDALRGKRRGAPSGLPHSTEGPQSRHAAMYRARKAKRADFLESGGDDRWKEWVLLGAVVLTAAAFVAQNSWTRRKAAAESTIKSRTPTGDKPLIDHHKHRHQLTDSLAASADST